MGSFWVPQCALLGPKDVPKMGRGWCSNLGPAVCPFGAAVRGAGARLRLQVRAGCGCPPPSSHSLRSPPSPPIPSLPPSPVAFPSPSLPYPPLSIPFSFLPPSLKCSLSLPFRCRPPLPWVAVAFCFPPCQIWHGTPCNGKEPSVLDPSFGSRNENEKLSRLTQTEGTDIDIFETRHQLNSFVVDGFFVGLVPCLCGLALCCGCIIVLM